MAWLRWKPLRRIVVFGGCVDPNLGPSRKKMEWFPWQLARRDSEAQAYG